MVDGTQVHDEDGVEGAVMGHERLGVVVGVVVLEHAHPPGPPATSLVRPTHCGESPKVQCVSKVGLVGLLVMSAALIILSAVALVDTEVAFLGTFLGSTMITVLVSSALLFAASVSWALIHLAQSMQSRCSPHYVIRVLVVVLHVVKGLGLMFGLLFAIGTIAPLYSTLENSDDVPVDAYYKGQVNADPEQICAMFHAYNCSGYTHLCPKNSTSMDEPRSELQPPTDAECPSVPHCVPASAAVLCGPLLERKVLSIALPLLILVCMCALPVSFEVALVVHRLVQLRRLRNRSVAVYRPV